MKHLFSHLSGVIVLLALINLSSQYKTLTIESDDLCTHGRSRKIKLERGPKSGLIVTTSRLNDHSLPWNKNFYCTFKVTASSGSFHIPFLHSKEQMGIFAVIQRIVFRRNESTGECIDFVQFLRADGSTSRKFCGRQNAELSMDHIFVSTAGENSVAVGNAFDSRGDLEVVIFVAKEPLGIDEEMDLDIVFTAYRDCQFDPKDDLRPCHESFPDKCIYTGFFDDKYINCPYPDCVDEDGCTGEEDPPITRQSFGNKVLIGSISSLFIVFAIFVMCLWACRKHGVLCWSEEFAHPSAMPANTTPLPRVIEMNETGLRGDVSAGPVGVVQATAPDEDKDLPPSYDSLFPSR